MDLPSVVSITTSYMKAQEFLFLLKDAKSLIRQGYYLSELPPIETFCAQQSLFLIKSPFKVLLDDNDQFTNRGLRLPASNQRMGLYFVYISKDEKIAHLGLLSELHNNHVELGRLLGYPECCIRFFISSFTAEHPNLEHPPTNLWTNLTQRPKDVCLLSHFPCTSNCPESIALAKKYLAIIQQVDKAYAQYLLTNLTV